VKTERLPKILLTGFVSALALYIAVFWVLQGCRTYKGPWRVIYLSDNSGTAGLLITQNKLKISQRITFPNKKLRQNNAVRARLFDDPTKTNAPFGQVVFQDLTFLPGTVTLNVFGHEIEMLPRVLIVDKQEHGWNSNEVISVSGYGKPKPHPAR
jgi:hypothetical protein